MRILVANVNTTQSMTDSIAAQARSVAAPLVSRVARLVARKRHDSVSCDSVEGPSTDSVCSEEHEGRTR